MFEFWIKDGSNYKKLKVESPENADWKYFKSLKMTVEQAIDNMKEDMFNLAGNISKFTNVEDVKSSDPEIQAKIQSLKEIRTFNIKTKEQIITTLADAEFIICPDCNSKMYKIPISVRYEKVGNSYVVIDDESPQNIRYHYGCSNEKCHLAVDIEMHNQTQSLLELREQLLKEGYGFVPNKFGFWQWVPGQPKGKPPVFDNEEPTHSFRRTWTYVTKEGEPTPVLQMIDSTVDFDAETAHITSRKAA